MQGMKFGELIAGIDRADLPQLAQECVLAMTDTELSAFYGWVANQPSEREQQRAVEKASEAAQAEVVKDLQDSGKLPLPDALTDAEKLPEDVSDVPEWVNPGTDHSMMYREGDIVRYEGRIVRSTHSGLNHWEPGTLGFDGRIWEDITPTAEVEDPATGETITQWAPGIVATVGMKLTYDGSAYEVVQAHTTQADWLPDALPSLYKKL